MSQFASGFVVCNQTRTEGDKSESPTTQHAAMKLAFVAFYSGRKLAHDNTPRSANEYGKHKQCTISKMGVVKAT